MNQQERLETINYITEEWDEPYGFLPYIIQDDHKLEIVRGTYSFAMWRLGKEFSELKKEINKTLIKMRTQWRKIWRLR